MFLMCLAPFDSISFFSLILVPLFSVVFSIFLFSVGESVSMPSCDGKGITVFSIDARVTEHNKFCFRF